MIKKLLLIICAALMLIGCGSEKSSDVAQDVYATIEDDAGRKVILNKKPARVVVTSAGFLEPLHKVGVEMTRFKE